MHDLSRWYSSHFIQCFILCLETSLERYYSVNMNIFVINVCDVHAVIPEVERAQQLAMILMLMLVLKL